MKIKFKKQYYQTNAVLAVADCFTGQPQGSGIKYRIDPGVDDASGQKTLAFEDLAGFKNADIAIPNAQILKNIQDVQRGQMLPLSLANHVDLSQFKEENCVFVEMATTT